MRSFAIYGKWSVQTKKKTSKQAYTQCSHTSVGLTQARPNYVVIENMKVVGRKIVGRHLLLLLCKQYITIPLFEEPLNYKLISHGRKIRVCYTTLWITVHLFKPQ